MRAFTFDGAWFDIGEPEGYLDAVEWALDGDAAVSPEATVMDAEVGTGVQVLPGASVENVSLERAVVFPGARVADASLEETVMDTSATVEG